MENLGNSQEKAARRPEIDRVKTQIGNDFFKLENEGRERKAREVISGFGMQGVDTVDDLFNRTQAPGYNQEKAKETLRVMSTAVYEHMNEKGLSQVPVMGSYTVESMLPKAWVGQDASDPENGSRFASMVTQNFIDKFGDNVSKEKAFGALETIDYLHNNPDQIIEIDKQVIEAIKQIDSILPAGKGAMEAKMAALKYLKGKMGADNTEEDEKTNKGTKMVDGGLRGNSTMEEYMRESAEYARESAKYAQSRTNLENKVSQVSLDEILDSYLKIKAPRERAPQIWEYEVPPFLEGKMKPEEWRKLLSFEDAWLGAIYSKRGTSEYNNSLEKMKDGILNLKSLTEADFKTWYEDENLKLREVMHQISNDLLTKKPVIQGTLSKNIYAFETRINTKTDPKTKLKTDKEEYIEKSMVQQFVDNEDAYKLDLVKRLVDNNIVGNESVAKLAVALSMDIMEMGGVFSEADGLRKLGWESDAVRLAQRPERKFTSKVEGGELFAGPWTELANILSKRDFKEAAKLVKLWGVVPKLLAGSFLDQQLELADGEKTKKTMMEMIYEDEEIPFRDLENDLFFKWRKDHIMPAARVWMYITNKTPLEFSKQREFDNVISEWRTDLFNDVNQLRKNKDALLPTSVVEGAIGGSIGLWPFEGPYLRIGSTQDPERNKNYVTYCEEIFRAMGLLESEKNEIKNFFGVERKYMFDFGDKIVDLKAAQNMNSSKKFKDELWSDKHLLKPRKT